MYGLFIDALPECLLIVTVVSLQLTIGEILCNLIDIVHYIKLERKVLFAVIHKHHLMYIIISLKFVEISTESNTHTFHFTAKPARWQMQLFYNLLMNFV